MGVQRKKQHTLTPGDSKKSYGGLDDHARLIKDGYYLDYVR